MVPSGYTLGFATHFLVVAYTRPHIVPIHRFHIVHQKVISCTRLLHFSSIGYCGNGASAIAELLWTSQVAQSRQPCVNSHWLSLWEPCIFDPPTESTSLNRSLKNLSRVIMSTTSTAVQNLVKIRQWGTSGQIGEI